MMTCSSSREIPTVSRSRRASLSPWSHDTAAPFELRMFDSFNRTVEFLGGEMIQLNLGVRVNVECFHIKVEIA